VRSTACAVFILVLGSSVLQGCGKEHGMYEGSQISAIIALTLFYGFSFVCLLGSLLRGWGYAFVLAGVFALICCCIMLAMTPYFWLGIVFLVLGGLLAYMCLKKLRRAGSPSN